MKQKICLFFRSIAEVFFATPKYNIVMAVCILAIGLMPAINVYITGQLVAIFENPNANESVVKVIAVWGVTMLMPTLLSPLVNYLQSHINQLVTNRVMTRLMAKNASFHGLHAYDNPKIQDTTAVLKSQSRFRPTNFSVNLVTVIRELITVLALCVMLFSIKWWIPVAILISFIPLAYSNFKVASFSWQALMKTGKQSRFMDYFSSLSFSREAQKDIHLFNAHRLMIDKYNAAFNSVYSELKTARFQVFTQPIPFQFITIIIVSFILFSLYDQSRASAITISSAVVLLQSIFILNNRIEGLIQHGSLLYEILDYFKKYFAFLDYNQDIEDGHLDLNEINNIEFVNVSFQYPDTDKQVIQGISFTANKGESIAIVGHNGAGKSTLVHLLCRFWDVSDGQILINGQNIRSYKIAALRGCIGAVFQDFFKFNMTVNENITFDDHLAHEPEQVREVLGLSKGFDLDTLIGKSYGGIELSGGQWQKLAILRCLNSNSSLIILDEPTSAIDPKAEVSLYEDFKLLAEGRLSFMITHRLGSINGVDRVLVIDKGRLVQDDTPASLKNRAGVFQELWCLQSSLYL
ncbi:ABC transporter ATP-binding protein [Psychrobacter sanguinis]|uniref:ATP-binding cassette domain-containing protein n=1 Tax=Psychrobacter sanguinis TaxID=861445 RepID=A0A844LY81_9GAMM|nr:ABC transporter ATP-binding protein [Psychrobacter sanguinis]MUG31227.1 ATP-binding cassette domain-containing protein [Psychrobacter sanguinis]